MVLIARGISSPVAIMLNLVNVATGGMKPGGYKKKTQKTGLIKIFSSINLIKKIP